MAETPTYSIVYQLGDSLSGLSWQWKGSDGQPKDITGYLAELSIFNADGTPALVLSSDDAPSPFTLTGNQGLVELDATPDMMAGGSLAVGNYVYTFKLTSSDESIVRTLTKGHFRVDGLPS